MQITLTDHEATLLHQVLESYLKELRSEIIDTDNPAYRRMLRAERDTLMAVAERLATRSAHAHTVEARMVQVTAVLTEYD